MRATPLLVILFAGLTGCAGETEGPASERFVGEWMIDQPLHATYEASWYVFHSGGELEHVRDCSFGGPVPTGFVTDAGETRRCEFADRWSASDGATLIVQSRCSDGPARDIILGFPEDTSNNASGQTAIDVVSVDGEAGWAHVQFDWVWHKCGEADCTPQLACP